MRRRPLVVRSRLLGTGFGLLRRKPLWWSRIRFLKEIAIVPAWPAHFWAPSHVNPTMRLLLPPDNVRRPHTQHNT